MIADHIRTLSFAIADGIIPSNEGRGYVLRRVLRRAVRYGRTLDFHEPFFFKLVDVVAKTMGDVFPEVRAKQKTIQEMIRREEEAFNKTLDTGIVRFNGAFHSAIVEHNYQAIVNSGRRTIINLGDFHSEFNAQASSQPAFIIDLAGNFIPQLQSLGLRLPSFPGKSAFELYDTYGFPLDLTELMARERGLTVDVAGFEKLMEEQRGRARKAQKKELISI